MAAIAPITTAYYPESDGKPMGETDKHIEAIRRHCELLKLYFAGQDVYVSENLLVYYEQGNPKKFIVPDTFVVKGLKQVQRRVFKTWIERRVPNVVIEVTSWKTRKKDSSEKPEVYAALGVTEYFLFDPDFEYLDPPLQGYRLAGTQYERIVPDADGGLTSDELQLRLRIDVDRVEFYRIDNSERLLTEGEMRKSAEARAVAAEAEVARLRAELARRPPNGEAVQ